jgi:hypothetical protein
MPSRLSTIVSLSLALQNAFIYLLCNDFNDVHRLRYFFCVVAVRNEMKWRINLHLTKINLILMWTGMHYLPFSWPFAKN